MMIFGMTTQLAPVLWSMVAILAAAGVGILAVADPRELARLRRATVRTSERSTAGFGTAWRCPAIAS